jgi:hypothetical protein
MIASVPHCREDGNITLHSEIVLDSCGTCPGPMSHL